MLSGTGVPTAPSLCCCCFTLLTAPWQPLLMVVVDGGAEEGQNNLLSVKIRFNIINITFEKHNIIQILIKSDEIITEETQL